MDLYWYWPFLRREELVLADGVLRTGDRLVVHTTQRDQDPIAAPSDRYRLVQDLAGPADLEEGGARWVASRAATYVARAAGRRAALRRSHFDVCHVVYLNYFTDGFDLARLERRVPLVSTVHDVVPHLSRLPSRLERRLLEAQYRHAGTIVVHHDAVRGRLLRAFPVDPARVHVVPLPIPLVPVRPAWRAAPATVLLFGTLRRNKGVSVLLEAVRRLRDVTDVRFVVGGRGFPDVEREVLQAASGDARIVAEIAYATSARKHELYSAADLVVLPYTSFASQSAVLRDAYAYRVPLIVSDVGALGDTVRADAAGWVVPPGDVDALGTALRDALEDASGRQRASAAIDVVARARTPAIVGAQLRALYERTASGWAR